MPREKVDHGLVLVDGMIRYTSVSAIQTFDPLTYGGCPRRYFFKYVEKKKEPQTAATKLGGEGHEQAEHWLKTGEDCLSPMMRAGKHLMPKPGSDLLIEQDFGANQKAALALREIRIKTGDQKLDDEVKRVAGLSIAGIPLVGYIDIRHRRGEYIDEDGTLRRERDPKRTIEVVDHKTTSDFKYGKTGDELAQTVQMIGYANVDNVSQDADFVRLSHIYYLTRGTPAAKKVTTLISVEDARKKWERVEALGREMADVVRADNADQVNTQTESCGAFRVGCPHKSYCNRPDRNIFDLLQIQPGENMGQGLFETLAKTNGTAHIGTTPQGLFASAVPAPPIPAPPPPLEGAAREAAIAAEKALLVAPPMGFCAACGTPLVTTNTSILPSGTIKHIGCHAAHIGAINPPDAPAPNPITAAAPLPSEVIATIEDPEIKQRALSHAAAVAAAAPPPVLGEKKAAGRCSAGGKLFAITREEAGLKKKKCPECGKGMKIKPSDDFESTILPAHNMAREDAPPVVSAPPPPALSVAVASPFVPPVLEYGTGGDEPAPISQSDAHRIADALLIIAGILKGQN